MLPNERLAYSAIAERPPLALPHGARLAVWVIVYVDDAWIEKVGERNDEEEDQLDFAFDVKPNSRLSCQIKVTEDLDGLVVRTPAYQGR